MGEGGREGGGVLVLVTDGNDGQKSPIFHFSLSGSIDRKK